MRDDGGAAHERALLLRVVLVGAHEVGTGERPFGRFLAFGSFALIDELLDGAQFGAAECSVLVGFGECSLDVGVFAGGDLDRGVDGEASRFDACDEVFFAVSEEIDDAVDVGLVQAELFGDGCGFVVLCVEAFYFAQEVGGGWGDGRGFRRGS